MPAFGPPAAERASAPSSTEAAPDLIAYIEEGLATHSATGKVIPPEDVITEAAAAHHRKRVSEVVNATVAKLLDTHSIIETVVKETADAANADDGQVAEALEGNPPDPWRVVVEKLVGDQLDERREEIRKRVRVLLSDQGVGGADREDNGGPTGSVE